MVLRLVHGFDKKFEISLLFRFGQNGLKKKCFLLFQIENKPFWTTKTSINESRNMDIFHIVHGLD